MPDLYGATLNELIGEMQRRCKATLIAVVPNAKQDTDNPEDDVELFVSGNLQDKGWLLTALTATVIEEVRKGWTPHEGLDGDG